MCKVCVGQLYLLFFHPTCDREHRLSMCSSIGGQEAPKGLLVQKHLP